MDFSLDTKTMFITLAFIYSFISLVMLVTWRTHRGTFNGIGHWALGTSCFTIACFLIMLRAVLHPAITIVLANTLFVIGLSLMHKGILLFQGLRQRDYINPIAVILTFVLFIYYGIINPDLTARIIIISAAMSLVIARCAIALMGPVEREERQPRLFAIASMLTFSIGLIIRIFVTLRIDPGDFFLVANLHQSIFVLLLLMVSIGWTIGFLLLISGKLQTKERHLVENRETLIKEVHHRVKNNMAVIASLLSIQSDSIDDKEHLKVFAESQNRIMAMALVHEKLYQNEEISHINLDDYIHSLTESIKRNFDRHKDLKTIIEVDDINLDLDTLIPCGLILNEIITNAIKHAFDGQDKPELRISLLRLGEDKAILTVSDNGSGLPEGFDMSQSEGLGFKLIDSLVGQIQGDITIEKDNGATVKIIFPLNPDF